MFVHLKGLKCFITLLKRKHIIYITKTSGTTHLSATGILTLNLLSLRIQRKLRTRMRTMQLIEAVCRSSGCKIRKHFTAFGLKARRNGKKYPPHCGREKLKPRRKKQQGISKLKGTGDENIGRLETSDGSSMQQQFNLFVCVS